MINFATGEPEYILTAQALMNGRRLGFGLATALMFVSSHRLSHLDQRPLQCIPSVYYRVISINRKIRVKAACCWDIALNDFHKFSHSETSEFGVVSLLEWLTLPVDKKSKPLAIGTTMVDDHPLLHV